MPGAGPEEAERVVELRTERQLRLMDGPLPRVTALHVNGANHVTRPRALDDHRNALDNLRGAAASREESIELILEAKHQFSAGSAASAGSAGSAG